jgi:hypothetical protein
MPSPISRRAVLTAPLFALPPALAAARELAADVAIVGGGVGGCAAALAALRGGLRVVLTEETEWLGGQLTSQAVPPDEHAWIEGLGCTRAYRNFRNAVRDYYRRNYPLTDAARAEPFLNPGQAVVSRLSHEPRVALAVLRDLIEPYRSAGRLSILTRHRPLSADTDRDRVKAVALRDLASGRDRVLRSPLFIDATELGDLLPLTRTEYVTGAESRRQTGELHAPETAAPGNVQSFTVCFAMDYLSGADHTIERPANYVFWRDYVPQMRQPWPGKLLDWAYSEPITLKPRALPFDPQADVLDRKQPVNLWLYRRILRKRHLAEGACDSDITLVNWPQNDYWLGRIDDTGPEDRARQVARAAELSLSLLYWLQTEAPRPDGGQGWKGLRLRADVTGNTAGGLAMAPYVRESRRIAAEFTVLEQHVGAEARRGRDWRPAGPLHIAPGEKFFDSVGVGHYRIDLHPSTAGDNYLDVASLPFEIPLGALIPRRVDNLIAAAKNIGTTHITNGCYRLHPVEWNIGESAGALAAFCASGGTVPRAVRNSRSHLAEFQRRLTASGVELSWPGNA